MNSYQVHAWYYPNFYTFLDILNGKRCKIYENDIIYQSILRVIMEKYTDITIKHMNDNFFNNLIAILKKDKDLILDNNKIKTINEKLF